MKLKKIISLVLVFAMMVTVFSAISVSAAAATATLSFVAYNNDGTPVTGNLAAGNTYQIGVRLSDISENAFKGAQLAVCFDKDVLKFVDKDGNDATKAKDVFIDRSDLYNADEETGYYVKIKPSVDAANGKWTYTLAMSPDAGVKQVDNVSEIEVVKFRVKAIKNGQTGLALDPKGETLVTTPSEAVVTVEPVAFRVGDVSYVSGTPETATFTANYAIGAKTADEVVADLAAKFATVKVTYTDDEGGTADKTASITWAAPANYNSDAAGTYEFTGAVTAPEGVNYTGTAITVKANVTVDKLKVKEDAEISVNAKADADPVLPATITVTLNDDSTAELAVTWAAVTDKTAGTRDVEGTLAGTSNIDVDGKKAVAHVTFAAAATETSFKAITTPATAKVDVDAENIEDAAKAVLPATIYGTNNSDAPIFKDVTTWTMTTTAPEGGYKVGDVIKFKPEVEGFDFGDFEVAVTVSVPAGKKDVTFDKTTVEAAYKNDAGMTAEKATGAVKLTATYTDNTKVTVEGKDIAWNAADVAKFDGKTAAVYTINGTWSDIYAHTQAIVLKVTITNSGATKIEIKNSATAVAAITSLTMNTLSAKTVYAVLTPADAVDTITWSSSNTAYATVTSNGDKSATIKTKNSSGRVTITAKTGSGVSASFTLYVNGNGGGNNTPVGPYKGGNKGSNSLLPSTDDDIAGEEVIKSSPFTDLEGYNWAATQIETMRLLGIVSGKTSSTFAPADNVTRAEFLAMLVRLYNFQAGSEVKEFTDVSTGDWFYETVKIASSLGIAYGYENGAFDPNAVITREDMAVFAKRALDVAGIKPNEGLTSVFEDDGEISDYAHDAVLYMSGIGVINGMGDGTFAPLATANRAQAAVVVYNLYIKK